VVARGNAVYLVDVLAQQIRVRWADLGAPAPAFQDIPGPNGPQLNACPAGHPEAFITDDALWVTWYENCSPSTFQVFLTRWN
jgi:hypothetical protein